MKKYKVVISDQAEQDLRGIYEYIAYELLSPAHAAGQLNRLEEAIRKLKTFPEGHRRYEGEPWSSRNLRILPVDKYAVFYIPDDDALAVTVIRVVYSGRNMEAQLGRHTHI